MWPSLKKVRSFIEHACGTARKKTPLNIYKIKNPPYVTYPHATQQYTQAGCLSLEPCLMAAFAYTIPLWLRGRASRLVIKSSIGFWVRAGELGILFWRTLCHQWPRPGKKIAFLSTDFILSSQIFVTRVVINLYLWTISGRVVAKCLRNVHKPLLNLSVRITIWGIVFKSIYTRNERKRRSNKIWMFFKISATGCSAPATTAASNLKCHEFRFRR